MVAFNEYMYSYKTNSGYSSSSSSSLSTISSLFNPYYASNTSDVRPYNTRTSRAEVPDYNKVRIYQQSIKLHDATYKVFIDEHPISNELVNEIFNSYKKGPTISITFEDFNIAYNIYKVVINTNMLYLLSEDESRLNILKIQGENDIFYKNIKCKYCISNIKRNISITAKTKCKVCGAILFDSIHFDIYKDAKLNIKFEYR